jgi:hypothetical protein
MFYDSKCVVLDIDKVDNIFSFFEKETTKLMAFLMLSGCCRICRRDFSRVRDAVEFVDEISLACGTPSNLSTGSLLRAGRRRICRQALSRVWDAVEFVDRLSLACGKAATMSMESFLLCMKKHQHGRNQKEILNKHKLI